MENGIEVDYEQSKGAVPKIGMKTKQWNAKKKPSESFQIPGSKKRCFNYIASEKIWSQKKK